MLTALRRGIGTTQLYPPEHPLVESALTEAARTMSVLTEESGGAVLSVFDGALYLNEQLLPHASIEFNALLHGIGGHGIESRDSVTHSSPSPDHVCQMTTRQPARRAAKSVAQWPWRG